MDALLKILQTPIGTVLALAGLAIVFLAFFEVGKGTVRMRKTPKEGLVPAAIGGALILIGLLLSRPQAAVPVESTPAPTSVSVAFTEVAPIPPTDTALPPTEASAPTEAPALPTEPATSVPVKTLADGCIAVQTWQIDSTNEAARDAIAQENNCWRTEDLGITAEAGTLHISNIARAQIASGIYTPIGSQALIEFKVYVNTLYIVTEEQPVYVTFSIAPADNPMARQTSARFKLEVNETRNAPTIYFMLADPGESTGNPLITRHYEYRNTYDVRLELKGITLKVFINNVDTKETLSVPSGPKVFYVGYNLPLLAGADVEIKDITIDGVKK